MIYLSIGAFGILGIFCRYFIDSFLFGSLKSFPVATFAINILGSFVAGFTVAFSSGKPAFSNIIQVGLLVGFCGGFTTFSAYCIQSVRLFQEGRITPAIIYLVLSPLIGVLGVLLGSLIARVSLTAS